MLHYSISITELASSNKLHCAVFCWCESILFIHLLLAQHHGCQVFLCLLVTWAGCNSLDLIELPEEKDGTRADGWRPQQWLLGGQTQQNWSCSSTRQVSPAWASPELPCAREELPVCASKLGQRGAILQILLSLIKELILIIY